MDHLTLCCWQRYDTDSNNSINSNATEFFASTNEFFEPSILGAPSMVTDPHWYPDSGATHHLTSDFNAFTTNSNYNGTEDVKLGNGSGTPIAHIGSATYITPYNNIVIHLNQLLHVPNMTKNLISVSKFAKDNNVFFEFYSDYFLVKQQDTNRIILQGKLKYGLYVFPPFTHKLKPTVCNISVNFVCSKFQPWHNRLGHASYNTVNIIMKLCKVPCIKDSVFCENCTIAKHHQLPLHDSEIVYTCPLELVFADI